MPAVILLHGAIGAADQLQPLAAFLSQNGYDVHSPDFSGHGHAAFNPQGFGIEVFSEELRQYILNNKLEAPAVFGYSMGGYVALYLAGTQAGLLGPIATLAVKFNWTPETAAKESKMLDPGTILAKVPKFAEALQARHGDSWKELLAKTADMMAGLGRHNILNNEILQGIENQVMLGLGDSDTMVSLDETMQVRSQLKNGSFYMLPHTKHPLETVNVKLLGSVLLSFFS